MQQQNSYIPRYNIHDVAFNAQKESIKFYGIKEEYGCFSNFSAHPILIDNLTWPTTEHYFQAMKFRKPATSSLPTSPEELMIERIRKDPNPARAKSLGRKRSIEIREDWEVAKIDVMMDALLAKFQQHIRPRKLLISTDDVLLIEHTTRDSEWADKGDGTGKNLLGKCLMKVREIIKEDLIHQDEVDITRSEHSIESNENNISAIEPEKKMTKKEKREVKQKRKEEKRNEKKKKKEIVQIEESNEEGEKSQEDEEAIQDADSEDNSEIVEETEESNENQEEEEEEEEAEDEEMYLTGEQWVHLANPNHHNNKPKDRKATALQVREQRKRRVTHKRNIFLDAQGHSLIQREIQTPTTQFMGIRPVSLDDQISVRSSGNPTSSRPTILIPESALPSQAKVVVTRHQFKRRFINEEEEEEEISDEDEDVMVSSHDQSVSSFFSAETAAIAEEAEMISNIARSENQKIFREEAIQLSAEECADSAEVYASMLSDLLAQQMSGEAKRMARESEVARERCLVLSELLAEHINYLICSEDTRDMIVLEKALRAVDILSPLLSN